MIIFEISYFVMAKSALRNESILHINQFMIWSIETVSARSNIWKRNNNISILKYRVSPKLAILLSSDYKTAIQMIVTSFGQKNKLGSVGA